MEARQPETSKNNLIRFNEIRWLWDGFGRFFNKTKQFRGIATRYDTDPRNFLAAVKLVALRIWCAA